MGRGRFHHGSGEVRLRLAPSRPFPPLPSRSSLPPATPLALSLLRSSPVPRVAGDSNLAVRRRPDEGTNAFNGGVP
jgi:hypothetical protein